MYVFVCARCDAELTVPLTRVVLPLHAHQQYGNGLQLPVLMDSGTFAVEAASGASVVAPGDARGVVLIPQGLGSACCGLDGGEGPNTACEACGLPVASRIDDCSLWQALWLDPDAVRRRSVPGGHDGPRSWSELVARNDGVPPFEPIAPWASPFGASDRWHWSPRWVAAGGQALAHLLLASDGRAVAVPDGLAAEMFQRDLDALLPAGPPTRHAVLAGPELPAPASDAGILLVPSHPETGEVWTPPGRSDAYPVPFPFGVWLRLAFPEAEPALPGAGSVAAGALRDDPPAPRSHDRFRFDTEVFERTLERAPVSADRWNGGRAPRPGEAVSGPRRVRP
ncbi:hypothetical protein [Streptomyces sp. NPDC000983]|uniref:hypothetical protein n=1 Tax=Streptomyces sp. NPDC000983 TaxID=3154373 RepID=UPI0033329EE4